MTTLLLIDGDNIGESYVPVICHEAKAYMGGNDVCETYYFHSSPQNLNREKLTYGYGVQIIDCPVTSKKRKTDLNTTDISLAVFLTEQLYECSDLKRVILVANDKDYVPLAARVRFKFRKTVIMFYTAPKDTATNYYDAAVLLDKEKYDKEVLVSSIEHLFEKYTQKVNFSKLKLELQKKDVSLDGKTPREYLNEMFEKFPELAENYVIYKHSIFRPTKDFQ